MRGVSVILTITLAGLTSRWIAPRLWAKSRASAIWREQSERFVGLQRPAARLAFEQLRQADPVDQLGDEVHRALELAPLVDGDDVRVAVERGGDLRLVDEALADHVVGGVAVAENLERHLASEPDIRRRVHDRGAATMDRLVESVLVDDLTGLKRHQRSPLGSAAVAVHGRKSVRKAAGPGTSLVSVGDVGGANACKRHRRSCPGTSRRIRYGRGCVTRGRPARRSATESPPAPRTVRPRRRGRRWAAAGEWIVSQSHGIIDPSMPTPQRRAAAHAATLSTTRAMPPAHQATRAAATAGTRARPSSSGTPTSNGSE